MVEWSYIIHIGILSVTLLFSSFLRARLRFLQVFLVPAPMIAGAFLLVFYNFVAPSLGMNNAFLGELVYHLLNISFISMLLRIEKKEVRESKNVRRSVAENVTATMSQYGLQCVFGLLLTIALISTFFPDLFPAFGYILPLSFELGAGQAYSIGLSWESMGFTGASSIGLTVAAIGFIVGNVGGVILINRAVRLGWIDKKYQETMKVESVRTGFVSKSEEKVTGSLITTDGESLDTLSYHIALVMGTYLISWGVLKGIHALLSLAGPLGEEFATSLWGINFIFSALCAIGVKNICVKIGIAHTIDDHTLNRISGLSVDLTVASSLGAISLAAITGYWIPIIFMVIVGILLTVFLLPYMCSRLFHDHSFFRMLLIYGTATGTLPTGLALVRVVDPDFETPAVSDYMYSTGIVFILAVPLLLSINLPAMSRTMNNPSLFWIALGISAIYMFGSLIAYVKMSGKRALIQPRKFFYIPAKDKD
ncbi:sodium:glutamate symporter [Parasphaerochaeta coccoides]|uniref:Na+/glutamate symporter-like protein n=1 Tax=Parasphaerochaeta coccoides (strain ATCC BAA-1237 / DSM 17374 / SPN1) TaxID=760011 RepID=F4GM76_PARC1|nr:sodium:glutamate symporter [Parasphaerochaeta coccoides]AEC03052.1 Na+/glutamate symporter-like protein [Parasphaerochaeta coccoides DSM 17374]